jgi:methylenetetrahydrofolate dehydrogenase (NADP+) / methenyltetrahydrofolate cyclohydrolase
MAAMMMDGKALAERIRAEVAEEVRVLGGVGLVTLLVGDDPASQVYIRLKHQAAAEAGIVAEDVRLPETTSEAELLEIVAGLNADEAVDALLVQLPLPEEIDEATVIRALDPNKDVDGLHPLNAGELMLARPRIVPATARGVMAILAEYRVELDGARAVVVGRSEIVGKPVAQLLEQANATVTICHTHTRDLARQTLDAEVLVVAAGRAGIVSPDMVAIGAAVVDVGINRTEGGLVGDVDPGVADVAALMTPVPGGVGPMTIACLLQNAVVCAGIRRR